MHRVIILSELYFPEQTSTGYFLTKTAEGLAEVYEVKVITGPATKFLLPFSGILTNEVINKVEIWRCNGTTFDKNHFSGRLVNLITRSTAIFCKALLLCNDQDLILVVTNPPLLPFVALLLKWLKGVQFVLLIHDVYPEALVAAGLCKSSSIIVQIGKKINQILYNQAKKIITLGRDMTVLTQAKLSSEDINKIVCIPNWSDCDLISPLEKVNNAVLKKLEVGNKFIVLYAGNIGKTHGIEYVAEAAKLLQKEPNFHFIVSGSGSKKKWLEEYALNHKLGNISIFDSCPRDKLNEVINACDVAVISFVPGMAGVSVPSRMYNQMATGKPIIAVADDWSELAEVIQEEEIGWVVKPGDVDGLVRTIHLVAKHSHLRVQMGKRAAVAAQAKYTFTRTNKAYKSLFQELFANLS